MQAKIMRDVLIEQIYDKMHEDELIFFLSADFGAPSLDKLREKFPDRFINVGIAEQNLINVATGLALEGFTVYAYAISAFITMRAYEQIRTNLSLMAQTKPLNVNLIGVGAGLSYYVSGPTHHCLEDITLMRFLPNFMIFVPSDCTLLEKFVETTIAIKQPKYLRLEGKPVEQIYGGNEIKIADGFSELKRGSDICIVAIGYMTHKALRIAENLLSKNIVIGVIDIFMLKPINEDLLFSMLQKYRRIITLEEGFINGGGIDSLVSGILATRAGGMKRMGFDGKHIFEMGDREYLHKLNGIDDGSIISEIVDYYKV